MKTSQANLNILQATRRHGLTLLELLIAVAIIAMTAAALGTLARATQVSAAYVDGHSNAAQHARVTIERIQRAVRAAHASEIFPGAMCFPETISGTRYPDTLVVWKPAAGTTVAPTATLPKFSEIVVFCPNPLKPNELLEITSRGDTRTVPALNNASQWSTELWQLKTGNVSQKTLLTDRVRVATLSGVPSPRGCVRFETLVRPSATEISGFRNGTINWENLSWPQHWFSATTGLRQSWVRMELQLLPHSRSSGTAYDDTRIPFLGSATNFSEINR
jgi:prepilin-type N-terminal cleavage/methylation domain-containing protein